MNFTAIVLLLCGAIVSDSVYGVKLINLGQQDLFEGDIQIPKRSRNGILATGRWPNNTIYYEYGTDWSQDQINMILGAMKEIEDNTCIKFAKRTNERNYLNIYNGNGCSAYVGFGNHGQHKVSLQMSNYGSCWAHYIVLHELLHTVGLWHEQSRYDRDDYLSINLDNVKFCQRYNFDVHHGNTSNTYGIPYNYLSIMHYDKKSFSTNGGITMTTKDPSYMDEIGNQKNGAPSDYDKVNRIYQCGQYKNFVPPPVVVAKSASTSNEGICVDVDCYDDCPRMAQDMNYCDEQADYMRKWCPKTCGSCSGTRPPTTTTRATPATTTPTPETCIDNAADCANLAKDGYCQASTGWTEYMTRTCPKSCGFCSACTDERKDCKGLKDMGYCTNTEIADYMNENCARTCGKC